MHMTMTAGPDLDVTATFVVTDEHQGAPGLAHGGVLVTALDDTLGALNWLLAAPAVTARLDTSFRRPVPVGAVLHLHAQITGVLGRRVYCKASGRLGSPEGPVALSATAVFMQVPLEHFVLNGRPEDVARARQDERVDDYLKHVAVNP
jgi:acyl-coenzyme A thioesterase PaaI-like protein